MNRSYSKIRHIQEANVRLEKRLLSEQQENHNHGGVFNNLLDKLKIYGITENTGAEQMLGKSFYVMGKGNEYDSIEVMYNNNTWIVTVIQGGKKVLGKEWKMNGSMVDSIESTIISTLKPYLNMKIRQDPNRDQG